MTTADNGEESALWALSRLRGEGYQAARLVLPAPGDVLGMPGPPPLQRAALSAGAAIVLHSDEYPSATVLIPAEHAWQGHQVELSPAIRSAWPTLRQARSEFATAIAGQAAALTELDLAADRGRKRQQVDDADAQPLPQLPPDLAPEQFDLLRRSRMIAFLAATAASDDGAAVSAAEAGSRAMHLRELAGIARRAMAAAVSG